ncbi:MAG: phage tail protein [Proteobacteria bacterium]|nr:phage tail protein [Pseudomonadota bacterium]
MSSPGVYYPPPGFYFTVAVAGTGTPLQLLSRVDGSFQEASGIEARYEVEELQEGGENRYVHRLPKSASYPNLVLKRGYVTASSFLSEWAAQTVGASFTQGIMTQTLVVLLLGPNRMPTVGWTFSNAWPVRWVTGPFNSEQNQVLTEVLEFSYNYVTRIPLNEALAMVAPVAALITASNL